MKQDTVLETAEYICNTGKIVHDRIAKIQNIYFASCGNKAAEELSQAQLHAIKILSEAGELTMNELAELLGVSPPSASTMVDRLVEKGVVCREHSTLDRRKVVVRISPEALKIADEIKANIMKFFVELVENIGLETAQKWCDVLACVRSVLSEAQGGKISGGNKPSTND